MEANRSMRGIYSCRFEAQLKKRLLRLKVFFMVTVAREQIATQPTTSLRRMVKAAPARRAFSGAGRLFNAIFPAEIACADATDVTVISNWRKQVFCGEAFD
jgi:hypothetical protein